MVRRSSRAPHLLELANRVHTLCGHPDAGPSSPVIHGGPTSANADVRAPSWASPVAAGRCGWQLGSGSIPSSVRRGTTARRRCLNAPWALSRS
jgi:hypothetical protein